MSIAPLFIHDYPQTKGTTMSFLNSFFKDKKAKNHIQILGEFDEAPPESEDYLVIGFSPSFTPIQLRWRNNGLSADFLADYLVTFFPTDDSNPNTVERQKEIKEAVSYIANELLENAMKYCDETSNQSIKIEFHLYTDHLLLCATNRINKKNVDNFQSYIQQLLKSDPEELYIRHIESAEESGSMTNSRLGLLTMIDGYNVKIGWKFETIQQNQEVVLSTMVKLVI